MLKTEELGFQLIESCNTCKKEYEIPITPTQFNDMNEGKNIQVVFPELPADLRELLISGMCGSCFDNLFKA